MEYDNVLHQPHYIKGCEQMNVMQNNMQNIKFRKIRWVIL